MTLASALIGPEADSVARRWCRQRRQLQARGQLGEEAVRIIIPDRGSIAGLVACTGPVRSGAVVEGSSATGGNLTTENCEDRHSVKIGRRLGSTSSLVGHAPRDPVLDCQQ